MSDGLPPPEAIPAGVAEMEVAGAVTGGPSAHHPDLAPRALTYLPWLVAVGFFMENLDATIVNTAVPTMAHDLGVLPLSLKGIVTSYTLSLAVFIPISGWLADRFGTKRIFFLAITLFTLGSLLCGLSVGVSMLVAARIIQGIGGAMMTPVGRLALVRAFPRSQLLSVMNYVLIPALIGPLLGPFLGGVIVHWLHWRIIFLINLPFGLFGLWMVRRYMPNFVDEAVAPLDRIGFVLFGSGIALLSYVLEIFGEHRLPIESISFMAVLSIFLLAAYGWHASQTRAPVLALHLFRVRTFRVSVLGGFVTRLGIGAMPFLLPLLYQIGLGYPAWVAGLFTMPQALAAIGLKVMSRAVLERLGFRTVLIVNTVLLGGTMFAFHFIDASTPIWVILLISLAQGCFSSLQFTSLNTMVYADVADRDASKASSVASTAQQMALSFGVAFGALLAGWFLGQVHQTIPTAAVPALHRVFLVLGSVTIISSTVFWTLRASDGDNVTNRRVAGPHRDS